jgi:peptidoglycan/xylan/chitin deacetylase (PgdA/CDA1 family)
VLTLPILMYHKVQAIPSAPDYLRNYVSPEQFEQQVAAILHWGYTPITLEEWLEIRAGRQLPPKRPIALTFDDGYRSIYENAWPLLRRHGLAAAVFLVADCVGETNRWDTHASQEPLLDITQIAEMKAGGISFGSHTCTHRPLIDLPREEALSELTRSRTSLETMLGQAITTLAYPYNKQNRSVRALARQAGYRAAVFGRGRLNARWTNPQALMRIAVHSETTVESLGHRLAKPQWTWGL